MLIDTHCHLDAVEFDVDRAAVVARAREVGVQSWIVPAVARPRFPLVQALARMYAGAFYTLGIHPMYVADAKDDDLSRLRVDIQQALTDEKFIGLGEIGLDFFDTQALTVVDRQIHFYVEQLKLAREFQLPVILHVRRSQDVLLKYLRSIRVPGGFAHAFNGSTQQAEAFVKLGFKLGFGGAMTFPRALQIRRLATEFPLEALVLETDAPDMTPAWQRGARNEPAQLVRIAQVLAELRGVGTDAIVQHTAGNVCSTFPRWAKAWST